MKLKAVKIDLTISETDFYEKLNVLPLHLQKDVLRHRRRERQLASLCGKLLLREYLVQNNLPTELLEKWTWTALGKPHCEGIFSFSISHSGDWVVLAASNSQQVGIDIQKIRFPEGAESFSHLLHPAEWAFMTESTDKAAAFTRVWSRKEALVKLLGIGIFENIGAVSVLPDKVGWNGRSFGYNGVDVGEGYAGWLCVEEHV